jgi:lipopolysaccharide export system permease protein
VKTLHLYLCRQILGAMVMTVFVFTFVLLLGNVIKEVLNLLVNRQATIPMACHAILLLIPYVLAFSMPIGMLTATLLVFGRFSADQELTAARAGGISLVSLVAPVLLLAVGVSVICAWLNFDLAPSSRVAYKEVLAGAGRNRPGGFLLNNQDVPFGKYRVFAGQVHRDGTNLDDVLVSEYDQGGELVRWAKAPKGVLTFDNVQRQITLQLLNMVSMERDPKSGWLPFVSATGPYTLPPVDFPDADKPIPVAISDMTFLQLRSELDRLQQSVQALPSREASRADLLAFQKEIRETENKTMMSVLVNLNQQAAFSFACISFTLVGIPLGIRGHRRETSIGVAAALGLVLIYYSFMVMAQAWQAHPERYPCLIVWLPNFIFQAVGAVLLWRINNRVG